MSRFGKDLIAAMEEAAAHAQGKGEMACVRHKRDHSPDQEGAAMLRIEPVNQIHTSRTGA